MRGDIGGVRELIADYITNVKGGVITPSVNDNWRIVGNDWDEELHAKAIELLAAGELSVLSEGNAWNFADLVITEDDLT